MCVCVDGCVCGVCVCVWSFSWFSVHVAGLTHVGCVWRGLSDPWGGRDTTDKLGGVEATLDKHSLSGKWSADSPTEARFDAPFRTYLSAAMLY